MHYARGYVIMMKFLKDMSDRKEVTVGMLNEALKGAAESHKSFPKDLEIDYWLPDNDVPIESGSLELISRLDWGCSEGIYIDLFVKDMASDRVIPLATIKTLSETDDAFLKMAQLNGVLALRFDRVVSELEDKYGFRHEGYLTYLVKKGSDLYRQSCRVHRCKDEAELADHLDKNPAKDDEMYFVYDLRTGAVIIR